MRESATVKDADHTERNSGLQWPRQGGRVLNQEGGHRSLSTPDENLFCRLGAQEGMLPNTAIDENVPTPLCNGIHAAHSSVDVRGDTRLA